MRSSAFAGFLASAVFISGTAGFASTFVVGPYLGEHAVGPHASRTAMLNSAAALDPLAVVNASPASAAQLERNGAASPTARKPRDVTNAAADNPDAPVVHAVDTTLNEGMSGPITEDAFMSTQPEVIATTTATGGPLIAADTSSVMVASKLENGEPVLVLDVSPTAAAPVAAVDTTDPDNAVETTVISAPPSEEALVATATLPEPAPAPIAAPPVAAPAPEPVPEPISVSPRAKPSAPKAQLSDPSDNPEPAKPRKKKPARVTTTAPAMPAEPKKAEAPAADLTQSAPASTDLNAPYSPGTPSGYGTVPSSSDPYAPSPPVAAQPAPDSTPVAPPSAGPTQLVMPQ